MKTARIKKTAPRFRVVVYTVQLKPVLTQLVAADGEYNQTVSETLRQLFEENPTSVVMESSSVATPEDIERLR